MNNRNCKRKSLRTPQNQIYVNKTKFLKRECILNFQKEYWKQRAKTKHIKLFDTNTSYFHKIATGKRNRKLIRQIITQKGVHVVGKENITKEISMEFKQRFEKEDKVTSEMQNKLSRPYYHTNFQK